MMHVPTLGEAITLIVCAIVFHFACRAIVAHGKQAAARTQERNDDIAQAIRDVALEYQTAFDNDYSARDARAHVRAYIHYSYPQYSKGVQRELMRDGIHQALIEIHNARHQRTMKDINPVPNK